MTLVKKVVLAKINLKDKEIYVTMIFLFRNQSEAENSDMEVEVLPSSREEIGIVIDKDSVKMDLIPDQKDFKGMGVTEDNFYTCPYCEYKNVKKFSAQEHLNLHEGTRSGFIFVQHLRGF